MGTHVHLPDIELDEQEAKLLLSIKLFEEGIVSLGKASEIAGYSEKAYSEILLHRGIPPFKYANLDLNKELQNA